MCEVRITGIEQELRAEIAALKQRVAALESLIRETVTLRDLLYAGYGIDEGRGILDSCDSEGSG